MGCRQSGVTVNAVPSPACLYLLWFNRLMYWAIGRLLFDQDLACDAIVLARTGNADVLLKTQLAYAGWMSLAIYHPLKERIATLKRLWSRPVPLAMRQSHNFTSSG